MYPRLKHIYVTFGYIPTQQIKIILLTFVINGNEGVVGSTE